MDEHTLLLATFGPLGFAEVGRDGELRKPLPQLASRYDPRLHHLLRDRPLWIEVWPEVPLDGGLVESRIGITAASRPGNPMTGHQYVFPTIESLCLTAEVIVAHLEATVDQHLCRNCGSLLVKKSSSHGQFFGCEQFVNPAIGCAGTRTGPWDSDGPSRM